MCKLQLEPLHNIGGLLFARIFAEIKFYIVKILNKWDKLTGDLTNKKNTKKTFKNWGKISQNCRKILCN